MSNVKRNDWALTLLENKNMTLADLKSAGVSGENTGLLSKKDYEKSPLIREAFTRDDKFDQKAFDNFYKQAATSYQAFTQDEFEDKIMADSSFDPFNTLRPNKSTDRDLNFNVSKVENPNRLKSGVDGINRISNPLYTASELAQMEKVYNYETGKFEDYSPNDNTLMNNPIGFFKSLSSPLVLATYDENGTHINMYGREVEHKAGDLKKNEDGMYYYETLAGRTPYDKQFKSAFDSITVDGSGLNKYDFFDSDGLNKSVTGTIMKSAVAIAPMFIPGALPYYGAALVGAELFNILPFVYNSTLGVGEENKMSNNLWGIGHTLKNGVSQHSKDNMITTENVINILTDVALQWAQQRAIFSGYHKLFGTEKITQDITKEAAEKVQQRVILKGLLTDQLDPESMAKQTQSITKIIANNKLKPLLDAKNRTAANASLGYMAILTGQEQFSDAINQGATEAEAAALAWGSIIGIYGVTRTGLGEIFLPELGEAREASIKSLSELTKEIGGVYSAVKASNLPAQKGLSKLFQKSKDISTKFWEGIKNHSLGFTGKMVGEGVEEVSEEFVMDLGKATFNLAHELGITSSDTKLNAFKDMGARYGMSFFGGALGGGVFAGVDAVQKFKSTAPTASFIDLIQNGQKNELLEELDKWEKKGKFGNTQLSATTTEDGVDGEKVWAQGSETDNQNLAVAGIIRNYINSVDKIINQESLNFSDEQIVEKIIMGDERLKGLLKDDMMNSLGTNSKFIRDWKKTSEKVVDIQQQIEAITNNPNGDKLSESDKEKLALLQQEKAEIKLEQEKFLNGTYSEYYVDQMLFKIDDGVNKFFFTPNFKAYAENVAKKNFDEINTSELNDLKESYKAYINNGKYDEELNLAYGIYKKHSKDLSTKLQDKSLPYQEFLKYRKLVDKKLFDIEQSLAIYSTPKGGDQAVTKLEEAFKEAGIPFTSKLAISENYGNLVNRNIQEESDKVAILTDLDAFVSELTQFGYIDKDSKEVILQTIKNISPVYRDYYGIIADLYNLENSQAIDFMIDEMDGYFNVYIDEAKTLDDVKEFQNELKSIKEKYSKIKDINEYLNDTKVEHDELDGIVRDKILPKIESDILMAMELGIEDVPSVNSYIDSFVSVAEQALSIREQEIEANQIDSMKAAIEKKLENVKNGPLMDFIHETSKDMFGKDLDIFKIIEDEDQRLGAQNSLFDYVLDEMREQEFDEALNVLDMTEAIINASMVNTLTVDKPFGHNQVMNDFLAEYFPKEQPYGIIPSDIAGELLQNLNLLRQRILFAKELSDMNKVNQFAEHYKTGEIINKLLSNALRGKDHYKFFYKVKYEDIGLLDGVNDIETFDDPEKDMLAVSKVIHENFKKMVALGKDSESDIAKIIFKQLVGFFEEGSSTKLIDQKVSNLNSRLERLEDYDILVNLASIFALDPMDFNYHLNEILKDESIPFAPLYSQEMIIRQIVSQSINPEIFNKLLESIRPEEGDYSNIKIFKNGIIVNGSGGAGKTSAIGLMSSRIIGRLQKLNMFKAGPTKEQAANLSASLKEGGKEYNIHELLSKIIGAEKATQLMEDIKNKKKDSELYDYVEFGKDKFPKVTLKESIAISNVDSPNLGYIDEVTHFNNFYLEIIGEWANLNGFTIVGLGDMLQNSDGLSYEIGVDSPNASNLLAIRTPKLQISMRITNIQKKDNVDNLISILNKMEYSVEQLEADKELNKKFISLIKDNLKFKYYVAEDGSINGEKIVNDIDLQTIQNIVDKEKENTIGIIYDNENSPIYKKLKSFVDANPQYEKQISFFTPLEVQGSEKDYFIIDKKFDFPNDNSMVFAIKDFGIDLYTMITRSKNGSFIIDNGISGFMPEGFNIQNEKTTNTPDRKEAISKFSESRKEKLNSLLEGYTPKEEIEEEEEVVDTTKKSTEPEKIKKEEKEKEEEEEELVEEEEKEESEEEEEGDEEDTKEESEPEPEPTTKTPKSESSSKSLPKEDSPYTEEFLDENFEGYDESIDADEIPLTGIRSYGWYKRWGVKKNGDTYKRNDVDSDIIDDLNIFLELDRNYTKEELGNANKVLEVLRSALHFNHKFGDRFKDLVKNKGFEESFKVLFGENYEEAFNNGEFILKIRKTNNETDLPIDKNGLDATKIENVAFDLVYRVPINNENIKYKAYDITVGKLANPSTWIKFLNDPKSKVTDRAKLKETATNYSSWYDKIKTRINEGESLIEFDIDKSSITFDNVTRLVPILDNGERVKFQVAELEQTHPAVERSPLHIYSGDEGIFEKLAPKSNDYLKGKKAIIFVTTDLLGELTYTNSLGETVTEEITEENMERLYNIQKDQKLGNKIRMIPLDANGVFILPESYEGKKDSFLIKPSIGEDSFDEDNKMTESAKKYLSTFGSIFTDAEIIMSLWNFRISLLEALEAIDKHPDNLEQAQKYLDTTYPKNEITIKTKNNEGMGMSVFSKNGNMGAAFSPEVIRSSVELLNIITEQMKLFINLPTDSKKLISGFKSSNKDDYNKILASLDGNVTVDGITHQKAYYFTKYLSNLFKSLGSPAVNNHRSFTHVMKDGTVINILDTMSKINSIKPSSFKSAYGFTSNLFNLILHGKPNPYNTKVKGTRSFAKFKNGIYFHPRYEIHDSTKARKDFYRAANSDNQFYSNVSIEAPNMNISINPTKLVERKIQSKEDTLLNHEAQLETKRATLKSAIANIISDFKLSGITADEFNIKIQNLSEENLNASSVVNLLKNTINSKIKHLKLLQGNDIITEFVVSEKDGKIVLDKINSIGRIIADHSNGAIKIDNNNNVVNGIINITQDLSDSDLFVVTLENGSSLEIIRQNNIYNIINKEYKYLSEISQSSINSFYDLGNVVNTMNDPEMKIAYDELAVLFKSLIDANVGLDDGGIEQFTEKLNNFTEKFIYTHFDDFMLFFDDISNILGLLLDSQNLKCKI